MKKQTKSQQKDEIRAILYAYPVGGQITKSEHITHLMGVFENHPEWYVKRGKGVSSIFIGSTAYGKGNRCFYLNRVDGSVTDISFIQCIDGKSSKLSDVRAACRSAIHPVIMAFRRQQVAYNQSTCPFTGEVLTSANTHIDHYDKTFNDLFTDWVTGRDVDWLYTQLNQSNRDMETEIYFTNPAILTDFITYHNANTHLRPVSKAANLSLLKRK